MTDLIIALISDRAGAEQVPFWLLRALVETESGGNPWAVRYEPAYRYLWNVAKDQPWKGSLDEDFPSVAGCSSDTELQGQKHSWGLCQVMGAVARERGFDRPFLSELCDPGLNLQYGAGLLAELLAWSGGDQPQALGAYNAGRKGALSPNGQLYAAKVLRNGAKYRT